VQDRLFPSRLAQFKVPWSVPHTHSYTQTLLDSLTHIHTFIVVFTSLMPT